MSSQRSATPWWFQATEVVPAEYLLQSATGRYLDVVAANPAAGARIQVWDRVAGENQQWTIVRSDEPGFIYLKSGMGRYLGVFAGSIKQGVPAQIEDFTGRNGQKRRLALTGDGKAAVQSKLGMTLTVTEGTGNGAAVSAAPVWLRPLLDLASGIPTPEAPTRPRTS